MLLKLMAAQGLGLDGQWPWTVLQSLLCCHWQLSSTGSRTGDHLLYSARVLPQVDR